MTTGASLLSLYLICFSLMLLLCFRCYCIYLFINLLLIFIIIISFFFFFFFFFFLFFVVVFFFGLWFGGVV